MEFLWNLWVIFALIYSTGFWVYCGINYPFRTAVVWRAICIFMMINIIFLICAFYEDRKMLMETIEKYSTNTEIQKERQITTIGEQDEALQTLGNDR